jgi:predicted metal-binding protein
MEPGPFREKVREHRRVLVFKFDIPTEILLSSDRHGVYRLLHETAAALEREALAAGCESAFAMAGGSCKTLFCGDHPRCRVLDGDGECRNPESARPSMSGLGVNVQDMCSRLGWPMQTITQDTSTGEVPTGLVVGAVLLG